MLKPLFQACEDRQMTRDEQVTFWICIGASLLSSLTVILN